MFDFLLAVKLTSQTFSLKKGDPRYPTVRRVLSAMIILPFFTILLLVNRFFMLLDWVFFPRFSNTDASRSCFITGVPRSATTYLFHLLAKDEKNFTAFKLWEILFAPSILQKLFFLFIRRIDGWIGNPAYRFSLFLDKIFFSNIAAMHEISLSKPEEDEILMLFRFSGVYLSFFFAGVTALEPQMFFDEDVPPAKRARILKFYRRCVQRHLYVFNRGQNKYFLSKNPSFTCKMKTIGEQFPGSMMIYMLRSPYKTIPSTISLNANIYSVFSGVSSCHALDGKIAETIIRWYQMADRSMANEWSKNSMVVPFKKITGQPYNTIQCIYKFLGIVCDPAMNSLLEKEQQVSDNYVSSHKYNDVSAGTQKVIGTKLNFIIDGKFAHDL